MELYFYGASNAFLVHTMNCAASRLSLKCSILPREVWHRFAEPGGIETLFNLSRKPEQTIRVYATAVTFELPYPYRSDYTEIKQTGIAGKIRRKLKIPGLWYAFTKVL